MLSVTCFPCIAQDENTYHSEKGHFSFNIPEGWEQVENYDIEEFNRFVDKMPNKDIWGEFDSIFTRNSSDELMPLPPMLMVNWDERTSQYDKDLRTIIRMNELCSSPIDYTSDFRVVVEHLKKYRFIYDDKKQVVFAMGKVEHFNNLDAQKINALFLGKHICVRLMLFAKKENFDDVHKMFFEVVKSFTFDAEYEYPSAVQESTEEGTKQQEASTRNGLWQIIGWIIWGIFASIAIVWTFGCRFYVKHGRGIHHVTAMQTFSFWFIAVLFLLYDWNKFHLFWVAPVSFLVAQLLVSGGIPIVSCVAMLATKIFLGIILIGIDQKHIRETVSQQSITNNEDYDSHEDYIEEPCESETAAEKGHISPITYNNVSVTICPSCGAVVELSDTKCGLCGGIIS
jgi:hypothetical protein